MVVWLGLVLVLLILSLLGVDPDVLLEALVAALVLAVLTGFVPAITLLLQIILFVVLGVLLFAVLRMGRKSRSSAADAASDLGTATVIAADVRPERWRVRWRGQSWAAVNGGDPADPLEQGDEVFVIEREGTCLRVIPKRCLLNDG